MVECWSPIPEGCQFDFSSCLLEHISSPRFSSLSSSPPQNCIPSLSSPRVIALSSREDKKKGEREEKEKEEYDSPYFSLRALRTDKARKVRGGKRGEGSKKCDFSISFSFSFFPFFFFQEDWGTSIPQLETGNVEEGAPASLLTHVIHLLYCYCSFVVVDKYSYFLLFCSLLSSHFFSLSPKNSAKSKTNKPSPLLFAPKQHNPTLKRTQQNITQCSKPLFDQWGWKG